MKAIAGFVLASTLIWAHEIGTTRVSVSLDAQREYRIEVVTDAASLMEKLGAGSLASFPERCLPRARKSDVRRSCRQSCDHLLRQGRNTGNRSDQVDRAHTRRRARVLVELWLDLRLVRTNGSDRGFRGAIDRVARGRRLERPHPPLNAGTGGKSPDHSDALPPAWVHAYRSQGPGPHAVRARHLPSEPSRAFGALAGQRIHRRSFHHARIGHVRARWQSRPESSSR